MELFNLRNVTRVLVILGLFVILMPFTVAGQGRGRGLGNKCDKFVNCHDARDGRWDGRGPRTTNVRYTTYRRHRRVWDDNDYRRRRRHEQRRNDNDDNHRRRRH